MTRACKAGVFVCSVLALGLMGPGCEEKKPVVKRPPPPPPVVEAKPEPVDLAAIRDRVGPDARVEFPQELAPLDADLAESVFRFADALARGDDLELQGMLDSVGRQTLNDLIAKVQWEDAVSKIEAVRVVHLEDASVLRPDKNDDTEEESGNVFSIWMGHEKPATGEDRVGFFKAVFGAVKKAMDTLEGMDLPGAQDPEMALATYKTLGFSQDSLDTLELIGNAGEGGVDELLERLESEGKLEALIAEMERNADQFAAKMSEFTGMASEPIMAMGASEVTFAIQQPEGAYLMARFSIQHPGPDAVFSPMWAKREFRTRASEFDGESGESNLMLSGFNASGMDMDVDWIRRKVEEAPGQSENGGEDDKTGPRRKNTPGGPVTIPGG